MAEENNRQPRIPDPEKVFNRFNVTLKDLREYRRLIADGKEERAIDLFMTKYVTDPVDRYNVEMMRHLDAALTKLPDFSSSR